jgi:hypothetical protein
LATIRGGTAGKGGSRGAAGLDSDRGRGPGMVCRLALPNDPAPGRASDAARPPMDRRGRSHRCRHRQAGAEAWSGGRVKEHGVERGQACKERCSCDGKKGTRKPWRW